MESSILYFKEKLKNELSDKRYKHSLNVMEEAGHLAKHYGADIEKCMLAGLVHDLAKEFSYEENHEFIKDNNLSLDLLNDYNRNLVHGLIASIILEKEYNFKEDMVMAIRYHSTGYKGMDLLAKIVYLADKIEKDKIYKGIDEERKLAYIDIDEAIILCLNNQIKCLSEKGKKVNPIVYETLEYLKYEKN